MIACYLPTNPQKIHPKTGHVSGVPSRFSLWLSTPEATVDVDRAIACASNHAL